MTYSKLLVFIILIIGLMACQSENSNSRPDSDSTAEKMPVENQKEDGAKYVDYSGEISTRINWQKPDSIIALMGDLSDKTVAEIGAGTGFFIFRLVPFAQKTIGVDIDRGVIGYLDSIRINYLPEGVKDKLELRLVPPNDPMIEEGEADIILIANTFAYLPDKENYLRKLKSSLKENGRLFIIDFKMHRIDVGPDRDEKIAQFQVEDYLIDAGYDILLSSDMILPYQYLIIAR